MKWIIGALIIVLAVDVHAWGRRKERIWYVKRKPVPAYSYAVDGDKVYLQTEADWPEPMIVSIRHLSKSDQEFIKTGKEPEEKQDVRPPVCPMLDARVSVDLGRKSSGGQEVTIQAAVTCPEKRTYDGKLVMEILLFGKWPGSSCYTVVEKETVSFHLPVDEPLQSKAMLDARNGEGVCKYAGYFVVVTDETGRRVAAESYPRSFAKHVDMLSLLSKGSGFDQQFNPIP